MIWRGIKARRLASLTIFILTALVVCGTVTSIAFGKLADVSRGSAGALVLLGAVALCAQAVESVRRREAELALARLRGRRGARLLWFAVAEPCLVVVGGSVVGAIAGWFTTRLVVGAWLPTGTSVSLGADELAGAVLVTVGALLLVIGASWWMVRAPLLAQLAGVGRPRAVTTGGLFLQLLLVIGAVVALYQADRATASRVDWVTLVSPAIVGLAGGQALIWLVLPLLAYLVRHTSGAGVGWFLTLRRLLRRADGLSVIRIVVAAGVVLAVAASAASAATGWREDRARLELGGPVSYPVGSGALRAYQAAEVADPHGRWLLPVASYTDSPQPPDRRVFVATDRWGPVVGDFFAGTPSAGLTDALAGFTRTPSVLVGAGDRMSATVVTESVQGTHGMSLSFNYVDDGGDSTSAILPLRPGGGSPAGAGRTRYTARVPGCRFACAVYEIDIGGYSQRPRHPRPPLRLVDATFLGQPMLAEGPGGIEPVPHQVGLRVERDGATLAITTTGFQTSDEWTLGTFRSDAVLPAVSTGGIAFDVEHRHPTIQGVDGVPRPITVDGTVEAIPFGGTAGSVLDLGTALLGSGGSIPETQAAVLARADTPDNVIAALRSTHSVGRPTTYEDALARLGQTPRAQGTRLYVLIALFAGLIAVVGIGAALVQQIADRRREAASLRVVGVRARAIAGAYRREALVLALTAFIGTTVAAWLAERVLLPALPLASGWDFAPPLDPAPRLGLIVASALVAGLVAGAAAAMTFRTVGKSSPPRILREEVS